MIEKIKELIGTECKLLESKGVSYSVAFSYNNDFIDKYSGYANHEHNIKIDKDTVFPISSITKQFTAMVIMIMYEEGLLDFNDLVSTYLKDFNHKLTIEDLLYQVSGLIDPYTYYEENGLEDYNIINQNVYKLINDSQLKFKTGEKFDYCNSNYILLVMIAETLYNKSFKEILKEKIFTPLDMSYSDLYDDRFVIKNRAYGYVVDKEIKTVDNKWLTYGDGGIISNPIDLIKWSKAIINNKLVSKETLDIALTSGKTNDHEETKYGFGWVINNLNHKIVRHAGGDTGFGSFMSIIPKKDFSIIFLSNVDNSWSYFTEIINKVEDIVVDNK